MRQALISVDNPITQESWITGSADVVKDTHLWRMSIVARVEGEHLPSEADDGAVRRMWEEGARGLRKIAMLVAVQSDVVCLYEPSSREDIIPYQRQWNTQDFWIGPPREYSTGDVYRCVSASAIPDQTWWPSGRVAGSTAIFFDSAVENSYRRRLEEALSRGDFDQAMKLMFMPGSSICLLKELMESAILYLHAGGLTKTAPAVSYFFRDDTPSEEVLTTVVKELDAAGFECFQGRSNLMGMIQGYWYKHGKLPTSILRSLTADTKDML